MPAPRDLSRSGPPVSISSCTTKCRAVLQELASAGMRLGLISNSHRCLASFQSHFELQELIDGDGLVVRPRLHEAASQHLRRRLCSW